ncbi:MAG: TonB-dependent receptor, partial [Gammaproteobacteria bacterium]|nr:TonB-dependent receptor [Gammaproteobacteria bacterium]
PLIDERLMFRVSAHQHQSNGFRNNPFLRRQDTNGRDESTWRGKLRFIPDELWQIDLSLMLADIDNGYDAFALDNGYGVLSDKPGRDAQRSLGAALRLDFAGFEFADFVAITSVANSDIDFDFDADWGNAESWDPFVYDFVSTSDRRRETINQEIRLLGDQWVLGVYGLRLREDLKTRNRGDYVDPIFDFEFSLDDRLHSDFRATNVAVFGQYEYPLGDASVLSAGIRGERRSSDYQDSGGLRAAPSETMWGGELSIRHTIRPRLNFYATLSKGYKAGGFNLGVVPDGRRTFGAEEMLSLEVGMRSVWVDPSLSFNLAAFVTRRNEQQVRTSAQLVPGDPASFVFFTDNIARGESTGFEADVHWQPNASWSLRGSLGLLDASFKDGREQAHAPDYTAAIGALYRHPEGMFLSIDLRAQDEFFFDVGHDQRSSAYMLTNARIGYESANWSVALWARNLFDEVYAVRGFFFGNEPPDFPDTLYTRLGDPRQVGVSFDRYFSQ